MESSQVEIDRAIDEVLREEEKGDGIDDDVDAPTDDAEEVSEQYACGPLDDFSSEELTEQAEEDPAAASSMVTVAKIENVPLFFARGVPERPQSFSVEAGFRDVVARTIKSVRARAPESFGELVKITSAGVFVNKPGMHGLGRAFDHDAWTFEHADIRPIRRDHASDKRGRRQRYWALAAIMRSHCAYILHGHYNAAHEDHIHQDNGGTKPFSISSEATVKLVQAICNHIYGEHLAIDGNFGQNSQEAVARALAKAHVDGAITQAEPWKHFLRRSGGLGFKLSMQD
jgi:hypothetical protein